MHVRVRLPGKPEAIIVVDSKLTNIETFRQLVLKKFDIAPELQRLFYGGKVLEDGYTFHDYTIKLNDVIQLIPKLSKTESAETSDAESVTSRLTNDDNEKITYEDAQSVLYRIGEYVDAKDSETGAWFEAKIRRIVKDPNIIEIPKTNGHTHHVDHKQITNGDASTSEQVDALRNIAKGDDDERNICDVERESESININAEGGDGKSKLDLSVDVGQNAKVKTPKGRKSKSNAAAESPVTPKRTKGITDYFNKTPKSSGKGDEPSITNEAMNGHSSSSDVKLNGKEIGADSTEASKIETNLIESNQTEDYGILYEVELEDGNEIQFCKPDEIRPRARTEIDSKDLKEGMTVLVNYNVDEPNENGFWYDFTIWNVKLGRKGTELVGTLFMGRERIPQDGTRVQLHQQPFHIETVVPLKDRTAEYDKIMTTTLERRVGPLNCSTCRDDAEMDCKDCGCYICAGKQEPEKIILCDECNNGFHMSCLSPPLTGIPNEDWYCPDCKRSPDEVIAPGGPRKQKKKANRNAKSTRDWGRGMACVGKTQSCAMPANHFGPIPGVEVGMTWRFRIQLSESGVHRPPVSGIHGRDVEGAYSLVLSGGYEDDVDNGYEFTYTGSGGRDLSGNKRTADQSSDQTLTRENKALARNCSVPEVSEKGADAEDNWRNGRPVRVVRSYKLVKHCPKYAPKEGIRYDGIYKVVKYYPETGKSGFRVWKYLLRRDDPNLSPWEKDAKQYSIVYPDGYLEAEAEKQAQKGSKKTKEVETPTENKKPKKKKRVLQETNANGAEDEAAVVEAAGSPPAKRVRVTRSSISSAPAIAGDKSDKPKTKTVTPKKSKEKRNSKATTPKQSPRGENPFAIASRKTRKTQKENSPLGKEDATSAECLSNEESKAIGGDALNSKLWDECLRVCRESGKKKFISHMTDLFKCIICQDVVANPVTTKCCHNFCMSCLKLAFKSTETQACSYCRQKLTSDDLEVNHKLRDALRTIMPGYDIGKK